MIGQLAFSGLYSCGCPQPRERIISLLSKQLGAESSGSNGPDGNEYADGLVVQGEAESYIMSWAALLADRKEVLIAERTTLAAHEDRGVHVRRTQRHVVHQ